MSFSREVPRPPPLAFLVCFAVVSGALAAGAEDESLDARYGRLKDWLQAGIDAADFGAAQPTRLDEAVRLATGRFGRSLVASKSYAKGDTILLLPMSHIVTSKDYSPGLESLPLFQQCAVYMAKQRLLGAESSWKPYLDMLPSSHDLPRYWEQELMDDQMQGSLFPDFVETSYTEMKAEWNTAWEATGARSGGLAWKDYSWGFDIFMTRAVYWDSKWAAGTGREPTARSSALFPLFDLLMHGEPNNAEYTFDNDLMAVKLYAELPIKEGEEVMITYFDAPGTRSNFDVLSKWGFAVDNSLKMAEVKLPKGRLDLAGNLLNPEIADDQAEDGKPDPTYALEQNGHDGASKAFLSHLRARASQTAMQLPDLPEGWWAIPDPRTGWMYFWHSADGETTWAKPGDPNGAKGPSFTPSSNWGVETQVLKHARGVLQEALAKFPTTLQQDLELLAGDLADHRVRFLVLCRRDEKQVLHWWLHLISNALARASDPEALVDASQPYLDPEASWFTPHAEL